ncbi:MAG TPA: hypothetical protein VIA45_12470, partial [Thermoanaerobaculia bacterium]
MDDAEQFYQATVDSRASLTELQLSRLVTRYEMGHYDEVLKGLPVVRAIAGDLGMITTFAKSQMLEGVTLKALGRLEESVGPLTLACTNEVIRRNPMLSAFAHEHLADSFLLGGRGSEGRTLLRSVAESLKSIDAPTAHAVLKMLVGQCFRL